MELLPPDILYEIFRAIDHYYDATALALTCKALFTIWDVRARNLSYIRARTISKLLYSGGTSPHLLIRDKNSEYGMIVGPNSYYFANPPILRVADYYPLDARGGLRFFKNKYVEFGNNTILSTIESIRAEENKSVQFSLVKIRAEHPEFDAEEVFTYELRLRNGDVSIINPQNIRTFLAGQHNGKVLYGWQQIIKCNDTFIDKISGKTFNFKLMRWAYARFFESTPLDEVFGYQYLYIINIIRKRVMPGF